MARAWCPQSQSCGPQRLPCPLALASPWTNAKNKKAREDCGLSFPSSPEQTPGATPHLMPVHAPGGNCFRPPLQMPLARTAASGVPGSISDTCSHPQVPPPAQGLGWSRLEKKTRKNEQIEIQWYWGFCFYFVKVMTSYKLDFSDDWLVLFVSLGCSLEWYVVNYPKTLSAVCLRRT